MVKGNIKVCDGMKGTEICGNEGWGGCSVMVRVSDGTLGSNGDAEVLYNGLFLACVKAADQKCGNYETLESPLTLNHAIIENLVVPFSKFREDCGEDNEMACAESYIEAYDNKDEFDGGDMMVVKKTIKSLKHVIKTQERKNCLSYNLTQWKAIKAKVTSSNEHRWKENVPPEQKKKIVVDASLSNWLVSPIANAQ
ncbi:hypothetical protein VNO78_22219 [Psophocarpus tetragonolobus]|uniref:Uncharacterized protein n=1 Tax=Psophocarpus tetragonolobus TaxID=3891 RepID=A0AAN9SC68_PSOTE